MTLDGEWKVVEGATAAEKAAMRFFKVVVEGQWGGAVAQERDPPAAKMAALHTGGDGTPPLVYS